MTEEQTAKIMKLLDYMRLGYTFYERNNRLNFKHHHNWTFNQ